MENKPKSESGIIGDIILFAFIVMVIVASCSDDKNKKSSKESAKVSHIHHNKQKEPIIDNLSAEEKWEEITGEEVEKN